MPGWAMVLIGLLVALVLLCGIGFWVVGNVLNQAGKAVVGGLDSIGAGIVVLSFESNLRTGEYKAAHDLLGGDLANRYSAADLQERWEALEADGITATDTSDIELTGDRPQIVWSVTPGGGGDTKDITLTMSKSGDDWKIVDASPELIPSP